MAALLLAGCGQAANETVSNSDAGNEVTGTEAVEAPITLVSFTSGDTATLAVPEMHCPFGCYPSVKETLEEIEGVELVELVPQKEEDVIDDRRVTIRFNGDVDGTAAVAALDKAGFPEAKFE